MAWFDKCHTDACPAHSLLHLGKRCCSVIIYLFPALKAGYGFKISVIGITVEFICNAVKIGNGVDYGLMRPLLLKSACEKERSDILFAALVLLFSLLVDYRVIGHHSDIRIELFQVGYNVRGAADEIAALFQHKSFDSGIDRSCAHARCIRHIRFIKDTVGNVLVGVKDYLFAPFDKSADILQKLRIVKMIDIGIDLESFFHNFF